MGTQGQRQGGSGGRLSTGVGARETGGVIAGASIEVGVAVKAGMRVEIGGESMVRGEGRHGV